MKSKLPNKKMFSFTRLRKSFVYAKSGIKASLKREQNLNIHMLFFVFAIICSIVLKISHLEFLIIILVSGLVISLELVNTAIENAVDINAKISKEAKLAKDAGSGAVLIAAITAIIVGLIIFVPKIIDFF